MKTNRFSYLVAVASLLITSIAGAQNTVYYNSQGQSYDNVQENYRQYNNDNYQVVTRNSRNFQDSEYRLPSNQRVSGSITIGVGNNGYYPQPVYPQPVYTAPPVQYYPAPQYYAPQPVYTAPAYPSYPVNNYGYNAPTYSQSYVNPLPWIAVGGITTALIYESNRNHRRHNYYNHRRNWRR